MDETRLSVTQDYAEEIEELHDLEEAEGQLIDVKVGKTWQQGYPYDERLPARGLRADKRLLQIELLKLQTGSRRPGSKLVIIFEGRDAAGKGGTIKRFMEHLNPRGARVVALEKPTERERTQWYFQRYVQHLPSGGEIVLFDRSWYNRAGVERVMGYCTADRVPRVHAPGPGVRADAGRAPASTSSSSGSRCRRDEQATRFVIRQIDPVRQWKLSPTDLAVARPVG